MKTSIVSFMATSDLFVDTSGLYALIDRRDTHHRRARESVERHVRAGDMLVVTDAIVSETVTLARARSGALVALRVLDLIEQSAAIRIERINEPRFAATKAYFRKYADQAYSFVDCASFVLMRELRLKSALTSDQHFTQAGFGALLGAR